MQRVKYPRTHQLPWSQSNSSDDVWWKDCTSFQGREVVVTEKLDGECATIYPDGHVHARSVDSLHHPSRSWIKALAARIAPDIPDGYRICGENLFAFHSIFYVDLPSYFFVYGIYDELNRCISWEYVEEFCALLDLETVPVLYRGLWNETIREAWMGQGAFPTYSTTAEQPVYPKDFISCEAEGYVVRLVDAFPYQEFSKSVSKYVRANHVTTPSNWMTRPVIQNLLLDHSFTK